MQADAAHHSRHTTLYDTASLIAAAIAAAAAVVLACILLLQPCLYQGSCRGSYAAGSLAYIPAAADIR
jgi:hypothetical protein